MYFIKVILLFNVFIGIRASSHWLVTENGLIQPKLNSPFEITNHNDLLAFLNQDTRWENIINLYHDLNKRNDIIRKLWSELQKDSDIQNHLAKDKNCMKSGPLNQMDWFASVIVDGKSRNIPDADYKLTTPYFGEDTDIPDCKKISSLIFSMFAFEHLVAMSQRENLTATPELSLPEQISPIMNIEQFGHWITNVLKQNSTSWLHYNLASLFWRVKGNAPKAVECSRRAVHYAPRQYKDLALLSLGTIFHRSKMPEDAIIVLSSALDHAQQPSNMFMLGNAYAVLGDFNNSLVQFEMSLKMDPEFSLAAKHKHAVLCQQTLFKKMKIIQESLDKFQAELLEYNQRESHWLKTQSAFLRTMKHHDEFDIFDVEKCCQKMTELTGLKIKEVKKEGDKNALITYFFDGPMFDSNWMHDRGVRAIDSAYNFKKLLNHIEKQVELPTEYVSSEPVVMTDWSIIPEIGPTPEFPDIMTGVLDRLSGKTKTMSETDSFNLEGGIILFPSSMKVARNKETFDTDPDWPSESLCKTADMPKNLEAVYPVFMPFENKGIRMTSLLTDMIGVPVNEEYELPWHPPICVQDSTAFNPKKTAKSHITVEVVQSDYLSNILTQYVAAGDEAKHMQHAEIGQRIHAAIEQEVAPKWLLYTLSSLYWRVRANNVHAVNCLIPAAKSVPPRHKDVVLVSLSSVYLEMGYVEEALAAAEEAFKLNMYEPATNFMIAQLNMLVNHRNTQLFHLKQATRVHSEFMDGLPRKLLIAWACNIKHRPDADPNEGEICTQVEPGLSMVCEKDGVNCHMSNIVCFNQKQKSEASTLVRMIELKDTDMPIATDHMDDSMFDEFISRMPKERSDLVGHEMNYLRMRAVIENQLKGCKKRGCQSIEADDFTLQENDCSYQHLQLGYWLQIINYRQLLADANERFPSEITSMTPSTKKVPDCQINTETSKDFLLDRLSRLDVEDWQPVLGLMHQFAETFNFFDYVTLGSKISKYIETRPRSWAGALAGAWWCGAGGRGACARRCLLSAAELAAGHAREVLMSLVAMLHMQTKLEDAKEVAYLMFYFSPKNKFEAYLVAVSHTYLMEYEEAVWMYRYAITFDEKFLPAKACLHATMCLMLFGEKSRSIPRTN